MMIDPRTVLVGMPCGDGRVMSETMGMLVSSRNLFSGITIKSECAIVQLARNEIATQFLDSPYEWLVSIDSDIVPRPEDFRLLLEPADLEAVYWRPNVSDAEAQAPPGAMPVPSRVLTSLIVSPPEGGRVDFDKRVQAAADMLVCAEYSYKNDTLEPVRFGFGFVRIHRIVFEKLIELTHPVNPDSALYESAIAELRKSGCAACKGAVSEETLQVFERCRPEPGGGSRLWHGTRQGKMFWDFFPTGPQLSNFLPNAQWKGEDYGFFMLCHMAGIIPRIETRTRLVHIGRKAYGYEGPNVGGGQ